MNLRTIIKNILLLTITFLSLQVIAQGDHYLAGEKDEYDTLRFVLFNDDGDLIISKTHNWYDVHRNGLIYCWEPSRLAYVVDRNGNEIGIDSIQEVSNYVSSTTSIVPMRRNDKWGFYSTQGQLIIPHNYDACGVFIEGKAPVQIADSIFYIDTVGNALDIPYKESWEGELENWHTAVTLTTGGGPHVVFTKNGKQGLRSQYGAVLLKPKFEAIYCINEKNVIVKKQKGEFGVISFKNETIIPLKYDLILLMDEDY